MFKKSHNIYILWLFIFLEKGDRLLEYDYLLREINIPDYFLIYYHYSMY